MKIIVQAYPQAKNIDKLKPDEKFIEFDDKGNRIDKGEFTIFTSDDFDKEEFTTKDGVKSVSYMLNLLELAEKDEIDKATRLIRDKYKDYKLRLQKPLEILKAKLIFEDDYDITKKVKPELSEVFLESSASESDNP